MNNLRKPVAVSNVSIQERKSGKQGSKESKVDDEVFCEQACLIKWQVERDETSWSSKRKI